MLKLICKSVIGCFPKGGIRLTAVIYARYSCDNQREESIDGQIRECTEFAERIGITVLRCYCDRALSAKTDNRPQFLEMIRDAEKNLFDMIIVWKLDRFARNRYDSARYKAQLKKHNVKVVSATEHISEGSEGILLESVLEGYAEFYSAELSEKVVRGMTENVLKGKFNGGTPTIGYKVTDGCMVKDELTAPYILEAFQMYANGYSIHEVRAFLNEHGVRQYNGKPVSYSTVGRMLKNRRYLGEITFRDTFRADAIPAIVTPELFERVQQKLVLNRHAPGRNKANDEYILTTKFYCGQCGAYMIGESGKNKYGAVYRYYKCAYKKNQHGDCPCKAIRKDDIENLIISKTLKMLQEEKTVDAIVSMILNLQTRENTTLPLLEHQLSETETAIANLMIAIEQGILTKTTKSRMEELEAMREDLEGKILNEKLAQPAIDEAFVREFLSRFTTCEKPTAAQKKQLIETFINSIFLFDDKVVITYNYMEQQDTVMLSDLINSIFLIDCSPKKTTRPRGRVVYYYIF